MAGKCKTQKCRDRQARKAARASGGSWWERRNEERIAASRARRAARRGEEPMDRFARSVERGPKRTAGGCDKSRADSMTQEELHRCMQAAEVAGDTRAEAFWEGKLVGAF